MSAEVRLDVSIFRELMQGLFTLRRGIESRSSILFGTLTQERSLTAELGPRMLEILGGQ